MVNHPALDRTFTALADPIRRSVLASLRRGERSVSELAAPHSISLPAFLKHLHVLERAGLLSARKTGRVRRCRLVAAPLARATDWLADYRRFWEGSLASLERYFRTTPEEGDAPWTPPPAAPRPSPRSRSGAPSRRPGNGSSRRGPKRREGAPGRAPRPPPPPHHP